MFSRKKVAMLVGEFMGTAVLTMVVLSVSRSSIGFPYFVGLGAGLAVAVMILAVGRLTGGHFNPAITFALWTARQVRASKAIVYIAAQLLGGAAAYWLYTYFMGQHWHNSGHYDAKILVGEAVGALVFGFGVAAAVYQKYEGAQLAFTVGLSLAMGVIVASAGSNGFLNPAVALGARSWGWGTYVLGPVLGAVIGVNLYTLLFASNGPAAEARTTKSTSLKSTSKKKG